MRGLNQRDFPSGINELCDHQRKISTPMASLHHELSAEKTVIPFSLSQPVSPIQASFTPF
ncbi:hypothetical protein SAMN04515675_3294 [Pseudomonas costantinii]|uniref:Uncharacterized protein n=1 Tax=Pseudomonas costantinii TaxID=168469 RepID=A0A1H5EW70_9PSED|nr:hypothetical protein SAMN04515675_3294 [Pseudomonas costantinii]